MPFATRTLARRIELAEARLAAAFGELARAWCPDVLVGPVGGTCAVYAGAGEPFNKLAGLGFDGPLDENALVRIEREFDARQAPLQAELAALADPAIGAMLTGRGYRLVNFENVLGISLPVSRRGEREGAETRGAQEAERADSRIVVAEAAEHETAEWIDAMVTGFFTPDTFDGPQAHETFPRESLERVFGGLAGVPGFRRYVARREGCVAGGGAVRISDRLAQLCGSATLPEHRRRGVQSALLRARLVDAARDGCDLAVVTTQPGSKSQENVRRAGFELLYTRAILVRAPR